MQNERQDLSERLLDFAADSVKLTAKLNRSAAGRHVGGQLMRAATSCGANYEEACAAESRADFVSKCSVSLKEARESKYWLRLLASCDSALSTRLESLIAEAHELISILTAILKRARNPNRGSGTA